MQAFLATFVLASATLVPLNDLGPQSYLYGYIGGLWDGGVNVAPARHLADGVRRAALIQPLDANGLPDPAGKIVFLGIGYGNTALTFEALRAMASRSAYVNHESLEMLNLAHSGLDGLRWSKPWDPIYSEIQVRVGEAGYSNAQVQAAWIQMINERPYTPLPIPFADAYLVKAETSDALRALKTVFPNLQVAYLSSPEYSGYDTTGMLGEPFAYEAGLSVRWVLDGQADFVRDGEHWDPRIGNLHYDQEMAPWITWGPYLWASGTTPRSDGLVWEREDFDAGGFALSARGAGKSARELLHFLLREPTAARWFRTSELPPRARPARH
jgi:hypothetical protein